MIEIQNTAKTNAEEENEQQGFLPTADEMKMVYDDLVVSYKTVHTIQLTWNLL